MAAGQTPCGIAIPQVFGETPVDLPLVRRFIATAETLGYDSLWVQDWIFSAVPALEPLSLLSYTAALTSRLRLGTSVLLAPLRNPVHLAKLLSGLDHLCQGRLTVGIGIGGHVPEALFGLPSEQRVRRFVEGIEVMKALWTEPAASVNGSLWWFADVAMEPKPVQKPHPPIWFGARQPPALKRAVHHGDGWMGAGSSSTADFVVQHGLIQRFLDEARRDPAGFAVSKRVYVAVDGDRDRAERRLRDWFGLRYRSPELGSRVGVWGSSAECVEKLAAVTRAGARHLLLNPMFDDMEHLEVLAREVVPHL
jgi:probable F420-dependent oxidoreductase